ncbi:MAG: DNA repair protein RecN [Alphaproteobacteria bacterium CG_4_10_14_0_8_um_filter_53_9]|nr:MAG: DNA repair protein RecN [Alphaproteobacteria bacterium CG_4_10_14_0_8_um_filter_53_9]
MLKEVMLTALTIKNIALIESAMLDFSAGLTVFTGETGAGKSMLMTALSLALGARAEVGHLRSGTSQGDITATFRPTPTPALMGVMEEQGLALEAGGELMLRRQLSLSDSGSLTSRAWVNGTPVPLATLAAVADHVLEHHGQHAHTRLMAPGTQRDLYDTLADAEAEKQAVQHAHKAFTQAEKHLRNLEAKQEKAEAEQEVLEAHLKELNTIDLDEAINYANLLEKRQRLTAQSHLAGALQGVDEHLAASISSLRNGSLALDKTLGTAPELETAANTLTRLLTELEDATYALARQTSSWEEPETTIEAIDDTLHALKAVARKHTCQPEDLPALHAKLSAEAQSFAGLEQDIKEAKVALTQAEESLKKACTQLTEKRQSFIPTFQSTLSPLLTALNLPKATLLPHMSPVTPTAFGAEELSFLFSANPGQPAQPLGKVASGGELSRLMLALKAVLYGNQPPKTLVLDEADTGLGGATAAAVGQAMRRLAEKHQVLTITHHAQVAAHAHHHLKIEKTSTDTTTQTDIHGLTQAEKEQELARMLAGKTITEEARAAAQTLLKQASAA